MTFAPRFSPDGNKVIMSLSRNGITDIYTMDLRTRAVSRLTNSPPSTPRRPTRPTAAKSSSIRIAAVLNSYVMSSDGDNVRRISFGKGVTRPRLVAARRSYRVHQNRRRTVPYWGHETGRFRGTSADLGVFG